MLPDRETPPPLAADWLDHDSDCRCDRARPDHPTGLERHAATDGAQQLHSRRILDLHVRAVCHQPGLVELLVYGKDRTYNYHFTYEDDAPYVYIPQDNRCPGFHRQDARTWCSALPGKAR